MRVAIVAESFLPNVNGVVNSVLRVIEHFDRTGHEAIIIAPGTPRRSSGAAPTDIDGVPVHHLPAVMLPRISSLPVGVPTMTMYHALADFAPDVVHLASPFVVGGAGAIAARKLGLPTVAVFQTDVAGFASSYGMSVATRAAWAWTRALHKSVDRTLAPSSVSVEALRAQGIPRVHQWGRGVDIERFAPSRRDENLRRQWLYDAGRPNATVVGFVGRLAPEKHVERLASLSGRDDVQLVIVGDGPERRRLESTLPDAVFTGELRGTELATAFASLDVFVHAGEHETFCQAVQEAMASGVPVIGPDAGGPRDLISHCRTGYLLPVPDFSSRLVNAMDTLVDPTVRAEFGSAARKSVLSRTWPAICDQLVGHYNDVLGRGAGRYRYPA